MTNFTYYGDLLGIGSYYKLSPVVAQLKLNDFYTEAFSTIKDYVKDNEANSIEMFSELSVYELYDILQLRVNIFVVKQKCPYPECDGYDKVALHLIIKENDKLIAYTRILPPDTRYIQPSIGRVVVDESKRGSGLGYEIMNKSIEYIRNEFPEKPIKIQAQAYLEKFYGTFGFKKISEEYLEDDIPHFDMILE